MSDRPLIWLGSSRYDVRAFPAKARRLTGLQLRRVQQRLDPNDWKAMPAIGAGVCEIRIHTAVGHRVLYVANFVEAVYVPHAFEKKSHRTSKREVDVVLVSAEDSCCGAEAAGGHDMS